MSNYLGIYLGGGAPPPGFVWQQVRVGGGGQICGIQVANDGTQVCRCDSFGAYVRLPGQTKWQQLCTSTGLPAGAQNLFSSSGVGECQLAPSNSQVIYMQYGQLTGGDAGAIFISTDQGATFAQTTHNISYPTNTDANRYEGPKGAVDPANPDVFYVHMMTGGAYFTTNGTSGASSTWTQVPTGQVPANVSNNNGCVVFDTSAGTTGGKTNRLYIASAGNGLYATQTPGGTFSLVTGTAGFTAIYRGTCDAAGNAFFVNNRATLFRVTWSGGTPTVTTLSPGFTCENAVCDPNNPGTVIAFSSSGQFSVSTNSGTSWGSVHNTWNIVATEAPYLTSGNFPNPPILAAATDPSLNPSVVYVAGWQGVYSIQLPMVPAGTQTITVDTLGIEQLAADSIMCVPGQSLLLMAQDWGMLQSTDVTTAPTKQAFGSAYRLSTATTADYCPGTPAFQALGTGLENAPTAGISTTNNWTSSSTFATQPSGGVIAAIAVDASNTSNILALTTSGAPSSSVNGGATWASTGLAGTWGGQSANAPRRTVCADRVNSGTFYAINQSNQSFTTTNTFGSWTTNGGAQPTTDFYAHLKSVPNNAGHLFYSCSGGSPGNSFPFTADRFWRSTNSGTSWAQIGSGTANGAISQVLAFGFGMAQQGQSYPAIYFNGFMMIGGVWTLGTFASYDNAVTWTQIGGAYPDNWTDTTYDMDGDMNNFGVVFYAKLGSSFSCRVLSGFGGF